MKVLVNIEKCIGSGMCTIISPSVFRLDEDGALIILKNQAAEEETASVKDAVACCPVGAISLVD